MPTIDELKQKYFVQASDANLPSEPVPESFADCKITPLIDLSNYNTHLEAALATVGTGGSEAANANHFIFIAGWLLGLRDGRYVGPDSIFSSFGANIVESGGYTLDPPANTKKLLQILIDKAKAGVDVRVLGWVSFAIMDSNIALMSGAGSIGAINARTMQSAKSLRDEPKLAKKVVLNVLSHTAGAVHNKMVIIGNDTNAVGFTGGLDLAMDRFAHPFHPGRETWHDVQAKVEGPAVQALYDHYQDMWQQNVLRPVKRFRFEGADMPSFVPGTPVIGARALTLAPTATKHHVQSLRTIPKFNYRWYNCLPENDPVTYAPNGLFSYKLAWKKALSAAESYIYMEDQSFWSKEILSYANTALKNNSNVRVILLFQGGIDPADPPLDHGPLLTQSINHGLLEGLTPAQRSRVALFRAFGDFNPVVNRSNAVVSVNVVSITDEGATALVATDAASDADIPANGFATARLALALAVDPAKEYAVVGNPAIVKGASVTWRVSKGANPTPVTGVYTLKRQAGIIMHTKSILVDDHWAVIGSGNIMRRSLYTDWEHGVGFIDEDGLAVRDYRCALWADHFRHGTPADFANIDEGLHAWNTAWGTAGAAPALPSRLEPISIPVAEIAATDKQRERTDKYQDLDSRQEWGGLTP